MPRLPLGRAWMLKVLLRLVLAAAGRRVQPAGLGRAFGMPGRGRWHPARGAFDMMVFSRRHRRRDWQGAGRDDDDRWLEEDRFTWQSADDRDRARRSKPHWTEEMGVHAWLAPHKRLLPWIVGAGAFLVGSAILTPFFGWIPAIWAMRKARQAFRDMPEPLDRPTSDDRRSTARRERAEARATPAPAAQPATPATADTSFAAELTQEARRKLARLEDLLPRIRQPDIARRTERIITLAEGIVANVERDPGDANRARRVLTFYLDSVIKIVDHALVIASQGPEHESLKRIPAALADVEEVMRHHGDRMLENDVLNLDTELGVLEQTLKAERPVGRSRPSGGT
ncbi:5-bromo-4-chloroindolyl phosphate hydrolysis family protein [Zavarzinia sp. CC-PAN008]|uniref:5-bromo-4-chloroindolyl phosphate hydrolysis family protein n=1 Tax=Zavarzinia sp. CC-PAN008 TaxID=3243332 RepID=UPI003F743ABD